VQHVSQIVRVANQRNPASMWYVLGGLEYLVKSKTYDYKNNPFTMKELLYKADDSACKKDWSLFHKNTANDEYAPGYCLMPSYFYALIVDGYGISPTQKINTIQPSDDPNKNADWT